MTICMKRQILVLGKLRNINLSSAELAKRVIMVNRWPSEVLIYMSTATTGICAKYAQAGCACA